MMKRGLFTFKHQNKVGLKFMTLERISEPDF